MPFADPTSKISNIVHYLQQDVMARRNDHSREELVEMTLNCVEEYLNTQPYHSLSLRKIAAMIGYVPSTLVNVFGSYNILLLHVVGRTLDDLRQQVQKSSPPLKILKMLSLPLPTFTSTLPPPTLTAGNWFLSTACKVTHCLSGKVTGSKA